MDTHNIATRIRSVNKKESSLESEAQSMVCLSRSVDGKPSVLYVHDYDEAAVAVKPRPGHYDCPIWIPQGQIFKYNKQLAESLLDAFRDKNWTKLQSLWDKAEPWRQI